MFTFSHFADAFIQSAPNTNSQALFKLVQASKGRRERER